MSGRVKKKLALLRQQYARSFLDDFYQGDMKRSQRYLRAIALLIGVVNTLFVIPDSIFIGTAGSVSVVIARCLFLGLAVALFFLIPRIRTHRVLYLAVTLCELCAAALFLFVLNLYEAPDFMIQVMGVLIITIAVYMVPNYWRCKVAVSLLTDLAFLILALFAFDGLAPGQYWAGAVYILLAGVLCGIYALWFLKYRLDAFHASRELQRVYTTDPLTKTRNRFKLTEEAEKWFGFCGRHRLPLSLVLIDVDDLKRINDDHGHMVGDSVLIDLGSIITGQIRGMDLCVRWGGDEFVLLLPNTRLSDAVTLSERIRFSIVNHRFECDTVVTCCFGAAEWEAGWSLEQLITAADQSMYSAKKTGKNKVTSSSCPAE